MDNEECYQMIKDIFIANKFRIIKEKKPWAFKFLWDGNPIEIRDAKKYLLDRKGADKYTVSVEGYVKFSQNKNESSIEWDIRASRKVEKRINQIKQEYTKKTCYITLLFVILLIGIVIVPLLMADPSHGIGNLILAIIFTWIPPLTVYTVLDYLQSNLKYLGVENVAKKIEKQFKSHQDKLQSIKIKRYKKA